MSRLPCPAELWPEFSRLLDQALDQPVAGRQAWLDSLPPAHRNLVPYLQSVLTVGNDSPSLAPDALAALTPGTVDGSGEVRDDDAFAPLAGEQVGPYTLERELGRGGMGMVWLAARSDGAYERQVALKLPHTHLGGSATLRRFRRERDILATLSHPNIAQFLDAGLTPTGHPYLALELVSGVPITEACRAGRQPLAVRVGLVRDVAAALHAAHARLIVHRDIKPSNVMVASDGTVKLLDFGIAKLLETDETGESNAAFTQLTVEGTRIATPDYAAPEQLTGAPITVATDVYSLAVLLYELLTGRRPFDRAAGPARLLQVLSPGTEAPRASSRLDPAHAATVGEMTPRELSRALAGDLDAILAKALAIDPAERYSSAEAFADDLGRYLRLEPIQARRSGHLTRTVKFVRRHRLSVGLSAALALASMLGIGGVLWQSARTASEARRANATKDFLVGVFEASDPRIAGSRPRGEITARELLDVAALRLDTQLKDDPETRSELRELTATIYTYLDELEPARRLARSVSEERLARIAVGLVLVDRVLHALRVVALEFSRRHRDAVDEQHQVEAVLVVHRVVNLAHHAQPVGFVPGLQVGVHGQRRLELAQGDRVLQSDHLETVAKHLQRSLAVECLAQALGHDLRCRGAVATRDGVPGLGLAGLDPGHHIIDEQGLGAVVAGVVASLVQPAGGSQVRADFVFEVDFLVDAHAATASGRWTRPRTSILPVTAAEMRAERRSLRRWMALCASSTSESTLVVSNETLETMSTCSDAEGNGTRRRPRIRALRLSIVEPTDSSSSCPRTRLVFK